MPRYVLGLVLAALAVGLTETASAQWTPETFDDAMSASPAWLERSPAKADSARTSLFVDGLLAVHFVLVRPIHRRYNVICGGFVAGDGVGRLTREFVAPLAPLPRADLQPMKTATRSGAE